MNILTATYRAWRNRNHPDLKTRLKEPHFALFVAPNGSTEHVEFDSSGAWEHALQETRKWGTIPKKQRENPKI